jgi:hypothetical protein
MKEILKRTAMVTGVLVAVTVPAGVAFAATGPGPSANPPATCTYDQQRLRLHDGTGLQHAARADAQTSGSYGDANQAGPQDGTGPLADRPLDGTGNQFGR